MTHNARNTKRRVERPAFFYVLFPPYYLFMAQSALGYSCRGFSIMADAALFALIHGLHGHPALSLFHREDPGMALPALKRACMELMAESYRTHAVRFIDKVFVKTTGCVMTAGAVSGREGLPAVMASPAIEAVIDLTHGDARTPGQH